MRKFAVCFSLFFLIPAIAMPGRAQESSSSSNAASRKDATASPAHFYRLDYVLEELDSAGKLVNSRSFSTTVSSAKSPFLSGTIVVGTRVPIATGSTPSKDGSDKFSTQITYIDVGVKITTRDVHDDGNGLSFNLTAELASLTTPVVLGGVSEPVIRQHTWSGDVLVPIGKRTVVFTSDSLDDKGSTRVVVTARPIEP